MQYALINELIRVRKEGATLVPSAAGDTPDPDLCRALAERAATGRSALVDVSDVLACIATNVDAVGGSLNRDALMSFVKPFTSTNILPMAWPAIVMTCSLPGLSQPVAWSVVEADGVPGYDIPQVVFASRDGRPQFFSMTESLWNVVQYSTMAALALASAKNAAWVEPEPTRAVRRHTPHIASIRFRHIAIDMGKPKSKHKTSDLYRTDDGVAWHHRRGHWAYYSPEKPLFGRIGPKNVGWLWRPYMEVGDKVHGQIVQDYSVKGNLPQVST